MILAYIHNKKAEKLYTLDAIYSIAVFTHEFHKKTQFAGIWCINELWFGLSIIQNAKTCWIFVVYKQMAYDVLYQHKIKGNITPSSLW